MKNLVLILTIITSCIFISTGILKAQNPVNFENVAIAHPEIELIIGLNKPTSDQQLEFTNPGVIDVIIQEIMENNDSGDEVLLEQLNDLLDEFEEIDDLDDFGGEPEKEELILVKEESPIEMDMYPNPAKNNINVVFEKDDLYQIEIYDLIGNKMLSEAHQLSSADILNFNLSNFRTGVYIMNIKNTDASTIKKFAIKH